MEKNGGTYFRQEDKIDHPKKGHFNQKEPDI